MTNHLYEISRTYEQIRMLKIEYKNVRKIVENMNSYLHILKSHENELYIVKEISFELRQNLIAQRDKAQSDLSEYFRKIRQLGFRRDENQELLYRDNLSKASAALDEVESKYQEIANDKTWYQKSEIPNSYKNVTLKQILESFTNIEHQNYLRMNELEIILHNATNTVQIHSIVRLTNGDDERVVFMVRKECRDHRIPENFLLCPVENLIGQLIYGKELGHEFIFPNSTGKWKIDQIDFPLDSQVGNGPDNWNFKIATHSWLIDSWR